MSDILTDDDFLPEKKNEEILSDSDFMEEPKKEVGVLEKTWEKVKSIPSGLADAGEQAYEYAKKSIKGEIPFSEQVERFGTAARGAADVALAPGFAAGQYLSGEDVDPRKPTQQIIEAVSPETAKEAEQQDINYPGARTVGQVAVSAALPMKNIGQMAASGALGSMTTQAANQGEISPSETWSDVGAGLAIPVAGKAVKSGISAIKSGIGGSIENRLGRAAEGKGAQFIETPSNIQTAKNASNINLDLKQRIRQSGEKAATEVESGLQGLRNKTNEAYTKLKQELDTLDQPVMEPNASPARIAYDKLQAALEDPEITTVDKANIREIMDKTFLKNPQAQKIVQSFEDNTPSTTLGENLQAATELKRNLGARSFKDNPLMDPITRASNHKMKALWGDISNTVDQGFAKEGLTNAEALYNQAQSQAKTEIPARNLLRKKLGTRLPGEQNNPLSADKIRSSMGKSDDAIKQRLLSAAKTAEADTSLRDISDKTNQIRQNQMLQSDWQRLNTPDGVVSSSIQRIPIIGPSIPSTAGQAIELYNNVKSVTGSAALAAAVKALTQGGKSLSRATIVNLAAQHKVDPLLLEQTIRENGN